MKTTTTLTILAALLFTTNGLFAQTKKAGPAIPAYGEVWEIKQPDYPVNVNQEFKAVFDIMNSPDDETALNKSIETIARFLNMHTQAGVPLKNLKVAIVVHNKASKDVILNKAYLNKYKKDNPNAELVKALLKANVQVILCGQSSVSRGFPKKDLIDGVQISLSAMTALIQLQAEGYQLIKF